MNTIKAAQVLTALVAILCIAFGYGTAWFAAGMIVGCISLTLNGLVDYIHKPDDDGTCLVCAHPFGEVRHACIGGVSEPHAPVVVFRGDDAELPYRPVDRRPHWDTDVVGAPE